MKLYWLKDLEDRWLKYQEERLKEKFKGQLDSIEVSYQSELIARENELKSQKALMDSEFQKVDQMKEELRAQSELLIGDAEALDGKVAELDASRRKLDEDKISLQSEFDSFIFEKDAEEKKFIAGYEEKIIALKQDYEAKMLKGTEELQKLERDILARSEELSKLSSDLETRGIEILEKLDIMEKGLLEKERLYETSIQEFETKLAKLRSEHEIRLSYENRLIEEAEFRAKKRQEEVEYLETKLSDRRNELEKANRDLKEQIRVIEAKARPDSVWTEAFTAGHSKAWDFTIPLLLKDYETLKKKLHDDAVDETLTNLDSVIAKRLEDSGKAVLRPNLELITKRDEFVGKLSKAATEHDKVKYRSYIEAIGWMLDGNAVPKS